MSSLTRALEWLGRIDTEDRDVERRGRALLVVTATFLASMIALGATAFALAPPDRVRPTLVVITSMVLVCVASVLLARRGRVDAGGLLLSATLTLSIGGYLHHVRSYTSFIWFCVLSVVVASITVRPRLIWVTAAANLALIVLLALILPEPPAERAKMTALVCSLLLPISAFTYFSARRTHALFTAQAAAMRDLEAARAQLADALAIANAERHRAEAANRAKSTFLANMSHELRTPLNAIIGYAELLDEEITPDNAAAGDDLHKIQHAGLHLLALIDDILDLSRVEAGSLTLEPVLVDLDALARELHETLAPSAERAGNTLRIHRDPACACAVTDPLRLKQILLNLLGNALKFTERGAVTLRISPADDATRFEIEDTGIGMDEATLTRVFAEFTQADESSTRRHGGAGLGLALSLRLARLLGARLEATSALGRGSTFTLLIPAEAPSFDERASARRALAIPEET